MTRTKTLLVDDRMDRTQRSHIVHVLAEKSILDVRVLDLAVRLHVVASRELLAAHRALVALRSMDVRMVPAIRDRFVAADAPVQRRKRAGQLHEQRRIVDVVVASRGRSSRRRCCCCRRRRRRSGRCRAGRRCGRGARRRHGQAARHRRIVGAAFGAVFGAAVRDGCCRCGRHRGGGGRRQRQHGGHPQRGQRRGQRRRGRRRRIVVVVRRRADGRGRR